jgi:hypothetical protein
METIVDISSRVGVAAFLVSSLARLQDWITGRSEALDVAATPSDAGRQSLAREAASRVCESSAPPGA